MEALSIRVRRQTVKDLQAIIAIENQVFDDPWTEEDFIACQTQRNCIGIVSVDEDERVYGYMFYELNKNVLHILNFVVHPDFRRRRVGRKMIGELTRKLSRSFRTRITMELREANLPAQQFLRACGFRATALMKGFWDDNEDAYQMTYRLPEDSHLAIPVNRIIKIEKPEE